MQNNDIQNLLEKVNLLFNVLLKDGIENTTVIERELLKEQVQKLLKAIDTITQNEPAVLIESYTEKVFEQKATPKQTEEPEVEEEKVEKTAESEEEIKVSNEPFIAFVQEDEPVEDATEPEKEVAASEPEIEESFTKENEPLNLAVAFPDKEFSTNEPKRKIREIIDLNKSFVLKAELFNGDLDAYNAFIQEIETIQTEKASFEYLHQLTKELNWDEESNVYQLIVRVIEKRFIPII